MNLWNKNQVEIIEVKNIVSEISNSIDGQYIGHSRREN